MERQTELTGWTVDAETKIAEIHKNLSEELVPHKITFIDYNGEEQVFELSHPRGLYEIEE